MPPKTGRRRETEDQHPVHLFFCWLSGYASGGGSNGKEKGLLLPLPQPFLRLRSGLAGGKGDHKESFVQVPPPSNLEPTLVLGPALSVEQTNACNMAPFRRVLF